MTSSYATSDHARLCAWLEVREQLERQLEPLGRLAMDALRLSSGECVLDIGCGIGSTPATLAEIVGRAGRVVGIDVLPAAIDLAHAELRDRPNVSFRCGDAQDFPFEPDSFDAAFSRFGVMFFAEPVAAFANLCGAMRGGGRLSFVCWRGLDENELDSFPLRAASACLPGSLVEDAASSAPFSFSDPRELRRVLAAAGFAEVEIRPHDVMVGSGDLQGMVDVCSRVGALGAILRDHPELRDGAALALTDALRPLDRPGGPRLNAAVWVVTGRAPALRFCR